MTATDDDHNDRHEISCCCFFSSVYVRRRFWFSFVSLSIKVCFLVLAVPRACLQQGCACLFISLFCLLTSFMGAVVRRHEAEIARRAIMQIKDQQEVCSVYQISLLWRLSSSFTTFRNLFTPGAHSSFSFHGAHTSLALKHNMHAHAHPHVPTHTHAHTPDTHTQAFRKQEDRMRASVFRYVLVFFRSWFQNANKRMRSSEHLAFFFVFNVLVSCARLFVTVLCLFHRRHQGLLKVEMEDLPADNDGTLSLLAHMIPPCFSTTSLLVF